MQQDASDAASSSSSWGADSPSSTSQRQHKNARLYNNGARDSASLHSYNGQLPLSVPDFDPRRGAGASTSTGDKEVDVLKSQVRDLEGRLLEEMVRSRELNATLTRHTVSLRTAEAQLEGYGTNFTALYRALVFVQRQLAKQRKVNKSLNKKLSNVLLDVQEVHNVMARGPLVLSADGNGGVGVSMGGSGKAMLKDFEVQSVGKVRGCPGATEKSVSFRDCAEVFSGGHTRSGVYYVKPATAACPVPVWCDMDTPPGGWLLLQRRQDGSVSFNRDWATYKDGFGNVAGEHWLGNDNMFLLTNQGHYQLRVDLWDFSGNRVHALYSTFRVSGERDFYQLTVTGFSGSAQDSLFKHNKMSFSTPDRDNDGRREAHCALEWESGWWFNNCWFALLNGQYHNRSDVTYRGVAWNHWKREQLRKTEMKILPLESAPTTAVAGGDEGNE